MLNILVLLFLILYMALAENEQERERERDSFIKRKFPVKTENNQNKTPNKHEMNSFIHIYSNV